MPYHVYIISNVHNTVFYTGVTNDLRRRLEEHRHKTFKGFTAKYNIYRLMWYETFSEVLDAIAAEKQVKDWRREKKIALIKERNPDLKDLSFDRGE